MNISALGDSALLLCFGNRIEADINAQVLAVYARLAGANWPGIVDLVPAYSTLAVFFDPDVLDPGSLGEQLRAIVEETPPSSATARLVELPVCYEGEYAVDLEAVRAHTGLTNEELVRCHRQVDYRVCFIGFAPGFPYLAGLDAALHMPRRATPRFAVPAGSVAIGGAQTGVYPGATPGGWHIIGRTPLALFDPAREPMCLLRAGDSLRFVPISAAEFARLQMRMPAVRQS
ncbi:MAG: 5-oxoprolinase subunit PxpB [Gammaproteobacteria bacterium]|nr:5-oxoprolinase subunit PxpB [Gammaproteobacteria bacterium]